MRKLFALLLTAGMFAFVACGGETKTEEATADTTTTVVEPVAPVVEDTTAAPAVDTTAAPVAE